MNQIAQAMLAEFEQESKTTRKFLERVPADKLNWKPHPKSRTAGQLALHIAGGPGAITQMAMLDKSPVPDFTGGGPAPKNAAEIMAAFDASNEQVRKLLPTIDDAKMSQTWSAVDAGGKVLMAVPRVAFLRSVLLNHIYHHRGQLGVYLRLLDVKVPSSYGPSADEMM